MKRLLLSAILIISCATSGIAQEVLPTGRADSVFIRQFSFAALAAKPVYLTAPAIPLNLYTQHLPFFCRQELKMQQAHVPVTFRLGSMENCNWLEQKPGYR